MDTIQAMFEECAAQYCGHTAVICRDRQLSYGELDRRANQLARSLRNKGVRPDTVVGLKVPRSPEMVIGLLAILKAGGAYLPIDSDYPEERVQHMLAQSRSGFLLTGNDAPHAAGSAAPWEVLDVFSQGSYAGSAAVLEPVNQPSDLAYVVFTSGSTGVPKGVAIEHRSVVNLIDSFAELIDFSPGKRILAVTTISFDVAVMEILLPLTRGMTVILADPDELSDVRLLRKRLVESKAGMLQMTPSHLHLFLGDGEGLLHLAGLTELLVVGEPFSEHLFGRLRECACKVYNLYGPTEATVQATCKLLRKGGPVTVGKPIANVRAYVVGEDGQVAPEDREGELALAGIGLARGYIHAPELTAEKFVRASFFPFERIYLTGDRARRTPTGEIVILGRRDRQVKLRGHRIELAEIENRLRDHPSVREAAVEISREPGREPVLCAYVVPSRPGALPIDVLREHLARKLPRFMVPQFFVKMERLPLTLNGKVDHAALPFIFPRQDQPWTTPRVTPEDEWEREIAGIWSGVLGLDLDSISMVESFLDLGGNSLSAGLMIGRLQRRFDVELPMAAFFLDPTVRATAAYVRQARKAVFVPLPSMLKEECELSCEQARCFLLHHMAPLATAYNLPEVHFIEGPLDPKRVARAFQQLVERHESLRTSFELKEGVTVQKVHAVLPFYLEFFERAEESQTEAWRDFVRPFYLGQAPLLRAALLQTGPARFYLFLDAHHIVADGISKDILLHDFQAFYREQALPMLPVRYRDYVLWQRQLRESAKIASQKQFWLNMFSGRPPGRLRLPADYPRPATRRLRGHALSFATSADVSSAFSTMAHESNATLFMILFSATACFLSRLANQHDFALGTPTAGRTHPDLQDVVGMFANTVAVRMQLDPAKTFREWLRHMRGLLLEVFENQSFQFDELVEALRAPRDPSHNPVFDVMFVFQETEMAALALPELKSRRIECERNVSVVDLVFYARKCGEILQWRLEYDTGLFRRSTAEWIRDCFQAFLHHLAEQADSPLCSLEFGEARPFHMYPEKVEFDFIRGKAGRMN